MARVLDLTASPTRRRKEHVIRPGREVPGLFALAMFEMVLMSLGLIVTLALGRGEAFILVDLVAVAALFFGIQAIMVQRLGRSTLCTLFALACAVVALTGVF